MNDELLQYALVGDLLQGGIAREKTLELIAQHGFKADYITVPELRTAYDILVAEKTNDATLLLKAVVGKVSTETLDKAVSKASDISLDVEEHIKGVGDAAKNRAMDAIYESVKRTPATPEWKAAELARRCGDFSRSIMVQAKSGGYSLKGVVLPPEEDDPDCLFHAGFLEKGGALVLGSVTGAGKSTLLMQLAFAWSLGRPVFGITPLRPLKIGVFQSENSLRDMVSFANGVRDGYVRFGKDWTNEDCDRALDGIRFFNINSKNTDDENLEMLYKEQLAGQFDLVVIDPLTGFASFDISDNTKMNEFLTKKLDPIIKDDPATKCALMFIHHTNKMSAANVLEFTSDQFAQYICAGAAKLPNWARGQIGVMPAKNKADHYYFVLGKRGKRLGWPKLIVGNKEARFPTKIIRQSTPEENVMFWHEVDATTAPTAEAEKPSVTKDAAQLADDLQKDAKTLTEARNLAKKKFGRKWGSAAYDEMMENLSVYNVVIKPTGKASQSIVGSEESVEKYFSQLQEKEAAEMRAKLAKIDAGK